MQSIRVARLDAASFAPYGWVLGGPSPRPDVPGFSNAATDFWQAHLFQAGSGGDPEIVWVNYRSTDPLITHLEMHRVTEQAIVPLTAEIIHIVAGSTADGQPDLSSASAFTVSPGQGICMRPGCWHATRIKAGEARCLMLTRSSTTLDLIDHLNNGQDARESAIVEVGPLRVLEQEGPL